MILNETMVDTLHSIRRAESSSISRILDVPARELGNCLISVYYNTTSLETRQLITSFMTEAGVVWLRKLLTRDTGPIASSKEYFASMSDYTSLLSANDEEPEALAI